MRKGSLLPTIIVCATALSITTLITNAGPLSPPGGPVASTNKTLQETEPRVAVSTTNTPGNASAVFRITQPGSYYLTGNVTGIAGRDGIQISASGVTLDLMGFDLVGVIGSGDAVNVTVGVQNVHIRNGSVRNWGDDGVNAGNAQNSSLERLHAQANANAGFRIGAGGSVRNCYALSNGGSGVVASDTALIEGCTSRSNGASVGGSFGIRTSTGGNVVDCVVLGHTGDGISVGIGSNVDRCVVVTSTGTGIVASTNSTIQRSTIKSNQGNGVRAFGGTTVRDNNIASSSLAGVEFSAECAILNNHLDSNSTGLLTTEDDSRVDGNVITGGGVTLSIGGAQNIITRNSFDGAYIGAVGSHWATIVTLSGNDDITTTNPWANFAY